MSKMMKKYILLFALSLFVATHVVAEPVDSVASPDGKMMIRVDLSATGNLSYSVERNGKEIIASSPLGFKTTAVDLSKGLALQSVERDSVNETYTLPTGKFSTYNNQYNEMTVTCKRSVYTTKTIFRAYNDGIAFRYLLSGRSSYTISQDFSEVNIPTLKTCWVQKFALDYSQRYPARTWTDIMSLTDKKMCAPALVKSTLGDDYYCLVTESQNDGGTCISALVAGEESEVGRFTFAMQSQVAASTTYTSPWRTVYIGSLPTLVESNLNENLNPATTFTSTDWIQAGLSSWDWGAMDGGAAPNLEFIKKLIDLAAEMNWKYFTLDDGWDGADYDLSEVTEYAKAKGVGVFIWSHNNRFKNDESQIRGILSEWAKLGFVGTKIDFFENDSHEMQQKYEKILRVAGEQKMMVNFHGCTHPSGLRRTYPNLVTQEAVYGGEMYFGNGSATPASHNITLALTRNVIGPMDYTPVEFATRSGRIRHLTTWSHQVAMATVFESGVQTVSDSYENVIYTPATALLKVLPASWDETRCLEAAPDQYVTIARRNGDDWYIGSLTQNTRTISLPLTFLGEGDYTAQIWYDGKVSSDVAYRTTTVTSASKLSVKLLAGGGCTIRLSKNPVTQPTYTIVECENGTVTGDHASDAVSTDSKGYCRGGKYVGWVGNGTKVTNRYTAPAAGVYAMSIFYMTGDNRNLDVTVNNSDTQTLALPSSGSFASDGLAVKTIHVLLKQGINTITFGNATGWGPNLDRLQFTALPADMQVLRYRVLSEDGKLLSTDEAILATGTVVSELPASLQVPLVKYDAKTITVEEGQINTYEVVAHSQIPATLEQAGNDYCYLTIRRGSYLHYANSEPYYSTKPSAVTDALLKTDAYQWQIVGNPYTGVTVYNKATGTSKTLTPKGTSRGDQVTMQDGTYKWTVGASTGGGFCLYTSSMCINEYGGEGGYMGMYGGKFDLGSSIKMIPIVSEDAILSPTTEPAASSRAYTIDGKPAPDGYQGLIVSKGRKEVRK